MRDIFTPVFLLSLAALCLCQALEPSPFVFRPLALAAFGLFLLLFFLKKYRPAYAAVAAALVLLICGSFLLRKAAFAEDRQARFPRDTYVAVRGTLLDYPEIGPESSALLLRASSFSWEGRTLERALDVRVTCRGDCRGLDRGDRIEVAARIEPQRPNRNFFPDPYENYLLSRGIHLQAFCKSAQLLRVTRRAPWFWRAIGAWRGRIRRAIEGRFLGHGALSPAGVFLEATVLGDRGRLENETREVLIGSGVFHMLAISGANIAMLALAALLLFRRLGLSLRLKYALTSLLLLLFLAVSGFDVPAERAVLMALLVFASRVWFMDAVPSSVISFSGLLLLMANPAQFLDPGFVLTFALTAAILAGRGLFLPLLKRLPRWPAELISANVSAALMAMPLSLYFFQRYAFAGFLSGLLLAPLSAGITVCGVLLLLAAWLPLHAAATALLPAGVFLHVFFAVSCWFYGHLSLSVFRPSPPLWLLALIGLMFFLLSLKRLKVRWRAASALLLATALVFVSVPPRRYRPGRLEAYFLDVGQGDAAAVVFPGGDALLVDGGGASISDFQVGRRLVLPFLLQKRIHVRWAAVSHYHPDHVRGMSEIIAILAPEELWLSSAAADDKYYRQLLAACPGKTRVREIWSGFKKNIGGCSITCLFPPRFIHAAQSANNHSMVLRVSDGRRGFLFCGDIEKPVESELAGSLGPSLASTVIKIPHHGSGTSSTSQFLDLVRPRLAVISVSACNSFGFPHPGVIGRLKERRARWLTTARSGGIMIASSPAGLEIAVSK
jgi:competence protein ComEC